MRSIMTCIVVGILTLTVLAQVKNELPRSLPDEFLNRQVPGDDLEYLPTAHAFYFSLSRTDVPGGMAEIINCGENEPKHVWRPMMSPLRHVLDAIVIADPRHYWRIEDGLINLLPVAGEPALLQTRISKFNIMEASSGTEVINQLLALPEVKKAMDGLNLKPGVMLIVGESTPRQKSFTVRCKDVSLRQALNAIARAQGNGIWSYIETHCEGRKTVVIRF